jgi:hypothetical protein
MKIRKLYIVAKWYGEKYEKVYLFEKITSLIVSKDFF